MISIPLHCCLFHFLLQKTLQRFPTAVSSNAGAFVITPVQARLQTSSHQLLESLS